MRTKCPFYGFYHTYEYELFLDQKGNQCPLIISAYAPCEREMKGKDINWVHCKADLSWMKSRSKPKEEILSAIEEMIENSIIFPNELKPKDNKEWEGISLRAWHDYIVYGKVIDLAFLDVDTGYSH